MKPFQRPCGRGIGIFNDEIVCGQRGAERNLDDGKAPRAAVERAAVVRHDRRRDRDRNRPRGDERVRHAEKSVGGLAGGRSLLERDARSWIERQRSDGGDVRRGRRAQDAVVFDRNRSRHRHGRKRKRRAILGCRPRQGSRDGDRSIVAAAIARQLDRDVRGQVVLYEIAHANRGRGVAAEFTLQGQYLVRI